MRILWIFCVGGELVFRMDGWMDGGLKGGRDERGLRRSLFRVFGRTFFFLGWVDSWGGSEIRLLGRGRVRDVHIRHEGGTAYNF